MSEEAQDIFGEARATEDAVPLLPVHARVLAQREGESAAWVFVCWSDPGSESALHTALRERVEAAFLAELSRARSSFEPDEGKLRALRLVLWPELDAARAVKAFGFAPAAVETVAWRDTLAIVRGEAQRVGASVADAPCSAWSAAVSRASTLDALEARLWMRVTHGKVSDVWGAEPGSLYALLAKELGVDAEDTDDAFRAMERAIVSPERGVVRFVPPLLFQAFADAAGVFLTRAVGRPVAWGLCEADDEGLSPPPILQLDDGTLLPIALEILRWCIMPIGAEETAPPPFADWLADFRK